MRTLFDDGSRSVQTRFEEEQEDDRLPEPWNSRRLVVQAVDRGTLRKAEERMDFEENQGRTR